MKAELSNTDSKIIIEYLADKENPIISNDSSKDIFILPMPIAINLKTKIELIGKIYLNRCLGH